MPLINNTESFTKQKSNQSAEAFNQSFKNQSDQAFNQQTSFNAQSPNQTPNQGLFQIPEKFLQLIPWIPVGLEMLTGQKIPATGVLADILNGIQLLQVNLQQVLNNQQQLWNKLENLESNAASQLTNLKEQLISTNNNFRLLATETKRSLEFIRPAETET